MSLQKLTWPRFLLSVFEVPGELYGSGGAVYGFLPKYTCIFFSLEEDNDVESKDEIDSDSTDLTDDDSDEATDTAVDTDDADSEESGKKIFRIYRVILLLPFRPI